MSFSVVTPASPAASHWQAVLRARGAAAPRPVYAFTIASLAALLMGWVALACLEKKEADHKDRPAATVDEGAARIEAVRELQAAGQALQAAQSARRQFCDEHFDRLMEFENRRLNDATPATQTTDIPAVERASPSDAATGRLNRRWVALREERGQLEIKLDKLLQTLTDSHPEVRFVQLQLEAVDHALQVTPQYQAEEPGEKPAARRRTERPARAVQYIRSARQSQDIIDRSPPDADFDATIDLPPGMSWDGDDGPFAAHRSAGAGEKADEDRAGGEFPSFDLPGESAAPPGAGGNVETWLEQYRGLQADYDRAFARYREAVAAERHAWQRQSANDAHAEREASEAETVDASFLSRLAFVPNRTDAILMVGFALAFGLVVSQLARLAADDPRLASRHEVAALLPTPVIGVLTTADGPALPQRRPAIRALVGATLLACEIVVVLAVVGIIYAALLAS